MIVTCVLSGSNTGIILDLTGIMLVTFVLSLDRTVQFQNNRMIAISEVSIVRMAESGEKVEEEEDEEE